MTFKAVVEEVDKRSNRPFQTNPPASLDEMFMTHAPELRIVADEIRQLSALLHEVAFGEALDLPFEARDAKNLGEHET